MLWRYQLFIGFLIFHVSSCSIPDIDDDGVLIEAKKEAIALSSLDRKFMYGMLPLFVDKNNHPHTGWVKEWSQDKEQNFLGYLLDGRKEGTWLSWDRNGTIRSKIGWTEDRMEGIFRLWHANEQVLVDGQTFDGEVTGRWQEFYSTGQLACDSMNRSGHLVSIKVWHPDGSPCLNSKVISGNGSFFRYLENGQPEHKRIFERGVETSREIFNQR